jgi:hypothetical protein
MTDERPCACHDGCSGLRGGPGCTSEPAPTGGYRPPYLAARAPVGLRRMALTEEAASELAALLNDDSVPTYAGRPALRIVRGEYDGRHGDPGDEHRERGE